MTTKHTSECDRQRHNGVRWSPAPLLPHIWAPSCILMICCSLISPMRYDTIQSNPIPPGWFITIDASWVFLSLFLTQPKSSITEFCIGEKSGILHSSRAAADCPIHHRVDKAVRPSGHKQSSPRSASQPGRLIK